MALLPVTLNAWPVVPEIAPEVTEKVAVVVPSTTLASEIPVVGLLVTVAEVIGIVIVVSEMFTTGPPAEASVGVPPTTTRVPVPAARVDARAGRVGAVDRQRRAVGGDDVEIGEGRGRPPRW